VVGNSGLGALAGGSWGTSNLFFGTCNEAEIGSLNDPDYMKKMIYHYNA
jgi:hypothetical protein